MYRCKLNNLDISNKITISNHHYRNHHLHRLILILPLQSFTNRKIIKKIKLLEKLINSAIFNRDIFQDMLFQMN